MTELKQEQNDFRKWSEKLHKFIAKLCTPTSNNNNQPKTTVKWLGIKNTDNKA